jgi:hypothetical protein
MTTIATIAAAVSFGSSAAAANPHPNIVSILSDDQGIPGSPVTVHSTNSPARHPGGEQAEPN